MKKTAALVCETLTDDLSGVSLKELKWGWKELE